MDLLSEYTDFLQEEDEEKKSKWKDRLKKYGKAALGVAAAGAAAYGGYKGIQHLKKKGAADQNAQAKAARKKELMNKPHATASTRRTIKRQPLPGEEKLKPGESITKGNRTVTKMTPQQVQASRERRRRKAEERRKKMAPKLAIARAKCPNATAVFKMGKFSHCK